MKHRFHALGIPHTITNKEYSACAFTQKVLKWCKMMTERGHTVYHYGHEDSQVVCTEHVTVTTKQDLQVAYGNYNWKSEFFKHNVNDHAHQTFYKRAIVEVGKRKRPRDYILLFWGYGHKPVSDAHPDLIAVEPGVGYHAEPAAKFSIYESYCVMNHTYALAKINPRWYDAVIPNYFDLDDFEFDAEPEDYLLFVGRIIESKGVGMAVEIAKKVNMRLKVAGQGDLASVLKGPIPDHVEIVGYVEPRARALLMKKAKALLMPTHFNEPFGGVMVEALLCGTPVITSDWGAFAENNIHGMTGYRCRTMEQFVWAVKNIDAISRYVCYNWAMRTFSLERVAPMYEEYFDSLMRVFTGAGFYEYNVQRTELDWLNRDYPCAHEIVEVL
jgi:glycosyltransferase involved in cell wall biosynthesis